MNFMEHHFLMPNAHPDSPYAMIRSKCCLITLNEWIHLFVDREITFQIINVQYIIIVTC